MEGFKISLFIIFFLASASPLIFSNAKQIGDSAPLYRLLDVTPVSYDLSLTVDPENIEFTGTVIITFNVVEENRHINYFYLHVDKDFIIINSIVLNDDIDCAIFGENEVDILFLTCSKSVTGDGNHLVIKYAAKFSTDDGYGLVKSTYLDQGIEQILIESSFKPTYARRAFPCMDEPDLRANFSISVTYPGGYSVISNTPVLNEYDGDSNLHTTVFTTTPKISTYLVSIFLSKFQTTSTSRSEDDVQFRVFTRPQATNLTNKVVGNYYSKIITELNNYTGVPYDSLNDAECYHIAVPDYSDGMDSFGIFTYRETDLLDEGDKTTHRATQNIVTAMAYKLSHEWYGDYLSTKWWSDVWANEAVATYLKYFIPNQVNPEFDLMNQFVVEVIQKALLYDGMSFAQPLSAKETDVNDVNDIEEKLDTFSNLKGASIIHTLSYVLGGDNAFQSALQYHWRRRNSLDTNGYDILNDLADTKNGFWYRYFEAWGFSAGYPVICLQTKIDSYSFREYNISRKRFVYPTENMPNYEDVYMVPITQTASADGFDFKFNENFLAPDVGGSFMYGPGSWAIFNLKVAGFYRVNYEEDMWRKIIDDALKNENTRPKIHVLNRAQLVDDIFNIARIGDVTYAKAFQLADFLEKETEYYPWYSAFNVFSYLLGKLGDDEVEANFKAYILNLMKNIIPLPIAIRDDETHIDALRNVMVLEWACNLGHADCISYATMEFKYYKASQSSINNYNLRRLIFSTGIRHSENVIEDWDFLWNVYSTTSSVHEQDDILNALGYAENPDLLKSYLLKTITANSGIKKQDVLTVFKSIFSSSVGLETAMEFLDINFANIASFYNGINILSEMVYALAEKLVTDEHVAWLESLLLADVFNDYPDVRTKAKVLASVNNYWKNNYLEQVKDLFPSTSTTTSISTTVSTSRITFTTPLATLDDSVTSTPIGTTTDSSTGRILVSMFCFILSIMFTLNT